MVTASPVAHAMVHPSQQKYHAAARRPPATVTLAQNGRSRTITLRPWLAGLTVATVAVLSCGTIASTAYLVFRDDLAGALVRQTRVEADYEERIAALRSEVDRVASRHVVETQGVEEQLAVLLGRQAAIQERQSSLDGLVERARKTGVETAAAERSRPPRPRPQAEPAAAVGDGEPLAFAPTTADDAMITGSIGAKPGTTVKLTDPAKVKSLISGVQSSLDLEQDRQTATLDALDRATTAKAGRISAALASIGAKPTRTEAPEGGPFIAVAGLQFAERAALLGRSLDDLAALRLSAAALPLGAPLQASYVSSRFGARLDPFLNRPSLHPGIDLVANLGSVVRATAAGTVVTAGWNGGYGQMVEIRHSGSVSTRYGHLSQILVATGATVAAGTPIGLVGSTGRSTGPHLHYETRRNGSPVDPEIYLRAGREL